MVSAMLMTRPDADSDADRRVLDSQAIGQALATLKHVRQFHTCDVATHAIVKLAHRERWDSADFIERLERHLAREAFTLGLRGPLPGHDSRGQRWAWRDQG